MHSARSAFVRRDAYVGRSLLEFNTATVSRRSEVQTVFPLSLTPPRPLKNDVFIHEPLSSKRYPFQYQLIKFAHAGRE